MASSTVGHMSKTMVREESTQPTLNQREITKKTKKQFILLPLPIVGHTTPIFQLASLLHSSGASITILHTRFNAPDSTKYPDFRFVTIPEPPVDGSTSPSGNLLAFVIALNAALKEPLRDCLSQLLRTIQEEGEGDCSHTRDNPPCCLIADVAMYSSSAVAEQLGIPIISARTSSAACFNIFAAFPKLREKGYLSLQLQDYRSETPVVEMPPYRVRDLPAAFKYSSPEDVYEVITNMVNHTRSAKALILNTFDGLEPIDIPKLKDEFGIPIYPIGPLHKLSPGAHGSLLKQDATCIDWLNMQHNNGDLVLYVSFGSLACMDAEELVETAWGLANSQVPFLWVLRPDSVRGNSKSPMALLPTEFLEKTKMRGKVVEWAPQQDVLSHPAVGGFWTHCGWNSTLEAICEGVPLLCWPCFGDQMVNARLVTEVWKVGITLENGLRKDEVTQAVRMLMVLEDGIEMRRRAKSLKAEADRCVVNEEGGGSSLKHLDALMNDINS